MNTTIALSWLALLSLVSPAGAETNEVAPGVLQIGVIQSGAITESSGIIPSRRGRGLYWTHNDSGADTLFAMTAEGAVTGQYKLQDINLHDWEDVAATPGRLYIADIGNNDRSRHSVEVYAVPEPNPLRSGELRAVKHWRLKYPDEPFNAESLFISRGYGYIISKDLNGGEANVYRFRLSGDMDATLERQCKLNVNAPPAGADLTANGRSLAVITRDGAYLFSFHGIIPAKGKIDPSLFVPFAHDRMEGCCFTRDGLLVTAESGEIFLFTDPRFQLRSGAKVLR